MKRKIYKLLSGTKQGLFALALTIFSGTTYAQATYTFNYTGNVQTLNLPAGTYGIEMWGADGGNSGNTRAGIGGYSTGTLNLSSGTNLYIVVGGTPVYTGLNGLQPGGYNGGGTGYADATGRAGGGATHIATATGVLSALASSQSAVLMVAGGGGGDQNSGLIGHGGGLSGGGTYPGTQIGSGGGIFGSFGQGGGITTSYGGGGGGGWYGGGGNQNNSGSGGSGYIGGAGVTNAVTTMSGAIGFVTRPNATGDGMVLIKELCSISLTAGGVNANGAICSGASVSLTTNAISNYSWNTGATTPSLVVSPTITTSYTLTAMSPSSCVTSAVITITVDAAPPTLTVTNTANAGGICPTKTVVLTASGATTYTWTGVTTVTNGVAFAPSVAGGYTVNASNACGTRSAATSVSVHPLPTVVAVASTASLCSGSTLTLTTTGSNASTYTWTGGYTSGVGFVPTATSIYTVTGTSALSCTALATVPVTVEMTPSGFPTSNPLLVCLGNSATLSVPAASNYTWTNGTQTVLTSTMLVTPTSSGVTTYTVTRANGVCVDTKVLSLTTNDLPTVLVLATPTLVCATHAASLAAAGGQTYTWTASAPANYTFTGASPVVYPAVNTTYTVAAHDGTCVNTAVISVSTNPLPTLTITPSPASGSICVGQQVSLTASGGINYTWTTVNTTSTGATVTDSPTAAIVYNLEGDNMYGCTSTAQQVMLVYPNPTVNISITKNPMVCTGGQSTLSANGANSYTWDANAGGVNTNTAAVTSTNSTSGPVVYTVTGSYNSTGCSSSKTIAISVFIPTLTVSGNTNTCDGGNVTLSASGGNTYTWTTAPGNPPYTFPTITASLSAPTVFTLAGMTTTSGISCPSSMTVGLGIYYNPTITATASRTLVCKGENVDLMADGGVSYVWSNSQPGGTITVVPTNISTYTVTGTDVNGCTSTGTVLVRYSSCSGISELNAQNNSILIYPNPNNGEFTISFESDITLKVMNELGQLVQTLTLNSQNDHKVSVKGLASGIYFIVGQSEKVNQKIVVNK